MTDELKFQCEECGREFDPDPDSMVELHWTAERQENAFSKGDPEYALTPEDLMEADVEELEAAGLTAEDREKLLRGEEVIAGAMCICRECQDRLFEEQS